MSFKKIIRFVVLFVVGVIGYLLYQFFTFGNQEVWQLIPQDAFAIVEVEDIETEWEKASNSPFIRLTENLTFNKGTRAELQKIDSVLKDKGSSLTALLAGKKLTFSMHQKRDGSFATLTYLPIDGSDISLLDAINKTYKKNSETCTTIKYADKWFMAYAQGDYMVYAYDYNGVVVFSPSEELMKMAIARTKKIDEKAPILEHKRFHEQNEANTSKLTLYLKLDVFFKSLKPYFNEETQSTLDALSHFEDNAFLDLRFDENGFVLNGFSHSSEEEKSFLSSLSSQSPDKLFLENYTSLRSVLVNFLHLSDGAQFEFDLSNYRENIASRFADERKELDKDFDIRLSELTQHFRGHLAYFKLKNRVAGLDQVLVAQVDNEEAVLGVLHDFAYKMSSSDVVKEIYHGTEISRLELFDFPALLLGEYYTGFDQTYYCMLHGMLVLSDDVQALKNYLDDIAAGRIWRRSLSKSVFVDEKMVSSNFGFYVDLPEIRSFLKKNLSPKGEVLYAEFNDQINEFENVLLQISADQEGNFYTDFITEIGGAAKENDEEMMQGDAQTSEYAELFNVAFDTTVITKPILVKNYKTKSLEVLVQTADFKLHNVSQKGEFKWSLQLDTLLIPEAFEIDFYKNGKLQYLLATKKSVYLLDRLGRHVEDFPFQLPNKNVINSFSLFDYDKNLKYRILLSDNTGAFYLFDKTGANLKGWDPLKLTSGTIAAPRHLRVRGRDFILAALDSGEVHLLNRKGEEERGFPIVLGERLVPGMFVDLKNSLSASIVSVLTASGKVESFNLNGNMGDEQLWLEGEGLEMLLDASGDGYALKGVIAGKTMIGQQDLSDLSELDEKDKFVQYYTFGGRKAVVVSGGKSKDLQMYVDDKNVMPDDLKASQEVGVLYSSRKNIFQIYIVINKQLRLVQLNGLK